MRSSLKYFVWLAVTGLAGLAALALTYRATREPAPSIHVRWRADVGGERQAELERRYRLVNGRGATAERSVSYDLLDTRQSNIKALVGDPDVADTNDINRREFVVRPGTSTGASTMWAADRIPALRDARIRQGLVGLLAAMAAAGLTGIWFLALQWICLRWLGTGYSAMVRIVRACRGTLSDRSDVFDVLPRLPASPDPLAVPKKIAVAAFILVTVGLPIVATWKTLMLAASVLAAVFSVPVRGWRRFAGAAAVVLVVAGAKAILPRADLAEAHNAFLVLHDGEALEQGLPPGIFRNWREHFDALYPASKETPSDFSWRTRGPVPSRLFTSSSDAIWRGSKYTRQVDAVEFHSLDQFRGGFANENEYNFWIGSVRRGEMPFYVMYELTPASVGSALAWSGQLFWQRADGGFDEIRHERLERRTIEPDDAGRHVFAAFFPAEAAPDFRFEPSWTLRLSSVLSDALSLIGVVVIMLMTMRIRWSSYARVLALFAIGYVVMVSYRPVRLEYPGRSYPAHQGGDDGLVHEGHGRTMAMLVSRGEIREALKGIEPVYWFTPGTRYVRMVEKLIFGDTNHLFALQLACFPIVMFFLVRELLGMRWAWGLTAFFLLMPVGNFSFLQYVLFAGLGYGEAWGSALFLAGVALLIRTEPRWGGRDNGAALVWCAGAALAASMFIRPNFALAVVWLGGAYAWACWRERAWRRLVVVALGLAVALWMPLHNWMYGGELYLISKAGATISIPVGVGDYVSAVTAALRGDVHSPEVALIASQLKGWLLASGFGDEGHAWAAGAAQAVRLLSLIATASIAIMWLGGGLRPGTAVGVLAVAALLAHVPMLFLFDTIYRYAVLAWDLSVLVLIVAMVRSPLARTQTRIVLPEAERVHAGGSR